MVCVGCLPSILMAKVYISAPELAFCYLYCNLKAKELFYQYCEHFRVNPQDFKGVELTDFRQLETFYETPQLFAMFLKEDSSTKTLYLSQASFPSKIYLNVFQDHLSLITDIKMHSKQFICNRCDKVSTRMLD